MFYTRSEWVYGLTTSDIPFSSGWVVYNRGKSGILGSIRRPSFLEGGGKNRMSSTGGTAYLCSSKDMQFPGRRRSIFSTALQKIWPPNTTWSAGASMFEPDLRHRPRLWSCAVYRRGRFSALFCSCCTPPIWSHWSRLVVFLHISTQTIHKYTGSVDRLCHCSCRTPSPTVLTM